MSNLFDPTTKTKCIYCKELIPITIMKEHEDRCEDTYILDLQQGVDFDYGVDDNTPAHTNDYDE